MRKLITFASMLLALAAHAGNAIYADGDNNVVITDEPCAAPGVIPLLPAEGAGDFKQASAIVDGTPFAACWRFTGRFIHLVFEDGDQGRIPPHYFRMLEDV